MLSQGSIDLALAYNMSPSPSVEFETLIEAEPYVLLSKNDPLASKQSVSLTELVYRDMISLSLPITQQFFLSFFPSLIFVQKYGIKLNLMSSPEA